MSVYARKAKKEMAHDIKALLSRYDEAYQRKFGVRAPIRPGKDAALAKQLLARYSVDQVGPWVDRFFESRDPFILRSGYTFGVFVACVGKLIVASTPNRPPVPLEELAHAIKIRERQAAEKAEDAQAIADEYYRTHPMFRPRPSEPETP